MEEKTDLKTAVKKHRQKVAAAKKEIKQHAAQRLAKSPNTVTSNRLKLLVTVVGRNKADYYTDLLQAFDVNVQTILMGHGTANAKMLDLLGLSDTDKSVIFSVIQESKIPDALNELETKFNTIKDGKGVACTIPVSSVIGTLIYGFLSNNRMTVKENK